VADSTADWKVITQPFYDAVKAMEARTDRATMWALREVGRQVKKESMKRAPVYKPPQGGSSGARVNLKMSQFRKFQKATKYRGSIASSVVISGLLRGSISSSRKLQSVKTGEYSLKVGPRGQRVHLYAGKAEARTPYMRPAYDVVVPTMGKVAGDAWARAMARSS
jgi:hypothetical protein